MTNFYAEREWVIREEYPDLSDAKRIAIDLETKDPELKKEGSGALKGKGRVVGIAIATENFECYYPIGHKEGPNLQKEKVLKYIQEVCNTNSDKIFHNAMYDITWLRTLGITIKGNIFDSMIAASLVDENRFSYTLNFLGPEYCGEFKSEKLLKDFATSKGLDPKKDLWQIPPSHVGHYAEQDATLTLKLWVKLREELIKQNLKKIFLLETKLFPCIVDMKFKGVRVDMERAYAVKKILKKEEEIKRQEIKALCGMDIDIYASRSIQKALDKVGVKDYGKTETGLPSFVKNYLFKDTHKHPLPKLIGQVREINKAHTTFIDTIIKHEYKGRIHADINQIRSDDGGTVTGRFSYHNPNLQQIPARNKDLGPKIRSIFIPEENCKWGCFDYSQQEPRLLVHYAIKNFGPNSKIKDYSTEKKNELYSSIKKIEDDYNAKTADFHQMVADLAKISRTQAKTINLGLMYGMGKGKLQGELGVEKDEAKKIFDKYHNSVGFVRELTKNYATDAEDNGVIETLCGRKCHFNKFQRRGFRKKPDLPLDAEKAMQEWEAPEEIKHMTVEDYNKLPHYERSTQRAFTYRALNKLIQGSAADQTKTSMVRLYEAGIVPHIQIHDELNISVDTATKMEMIKEITKIMEKSVTLEVPNKIDYEEGQNWGDINE